MSLFIHEDLCAEMLNNLPCEQVGLLSSAVGSPPMPLLLGC